jgi:hypothetical protein
VAVSKIRVQLDLSPSEVKGLDRLRDKCGLRSRADAVRTALAVLEWVEGEARNGRKVVAIGGQDVSYLAVPGMTSVNDRGARE